MTTKTKTTTLHRDTYGAIWAGRATRLDGTVAFTTEADLEFFNQANDLITRAVKMGLVECAYDSLEWDRKRRASGSALHHEIYDLSISRGRVAQVLLCVRTTQGNGKYGVSTTSKTYYLLTKAAKAIEIQTANKAIAAKAAKQAGDRLGQAIDVVTGKAAYSPNRLDLSTVYKRVAVLDGRFVSIFDGETEYQIGVEIRESAKQGHNGGIYCFPTAKAAAAWEAPENWPGANLPCVVLRCTAGGSYCRYDNGKISVSRLTPLEVVA